MLGMEEVGFVVGGYLSGSVLYSYLLPKYLMKVDVTKESSDGNPGAANAFLHAGIPMGILVLLLELLKGYVPVHLALRSVDPARLSFALILAAPVAGHACPFWGWKRGGKAIAVSFGVLLGLCPIWEPVLFLAGLYLLFSLIIVIRPHFFRSVITFFLFFAGVLWKLHMPGIVLGSGILSCVVIWKHLVRYRRERLEIRFPLLAGK